MFGRHGFAIHSIAVILLSSCISDGNARAPSRLIGGTDALPGEFPWQVSLRSYDSHICGGTIISKRHILTAGHCIIGVTDPPFSEMTVVTGSYTLEPGTGKSYRVKNIVVHKKYAPRTQRTTVKNDIAVISLRKEIDENDFQKAIPLPTEDVIDGVEGTVSGFGRTTYPNGKLSTILQKVNVTIETGDNCFNRGIRIQRNQICGYKGVGYGTCNGDSGGPLVYNGTIVGIVSTSPPCGIGIPDTYTRVYYFRDFIKEAVASI